MNIIKGLERSEIREIQISFYFFSFFFFFLSRKFFPVLLNNSVGIEGEQSKTGGRDLAVVMNRASDMSLQCDIVCSLFKRKGGGVGGRFRLFSSKVFFPTVKNNRK